MRKTCENTFAVEMVTTQRAHSLRSIKLAYPGISNLVTREADKHRTLGNIHRSITNAQKERTNKKRELKGINVVQSKKGKKARVDQK